MKPAPSSNSSLRLWKGLSGLLSPISEDGRKVFASQRQKSGEIHSLISGSWTDLHFIQISTKNSSQSLFVSKKHVDCHLSIWKTVPSQKFVPLSVWCPRSCPRKCREEKMATLLHPIVRLWSPLASCWPFVRIRIRHPASFPVLITRFPSSLLSRLYFYHFYLFKHVSRSRVY